MSVDSSGAESNGDSYPWAFVMSDDGRFVAFGSSATNLVAGDTNGKLDLFVRDRATGSTGRVSVDSNGAEANDDSLSEGLSMTSDGRFVAFTSYASNLVAGDTNGTEDVFVHDRTTGITERVSVDSNGNQTPRGWFNLGSEYSSISSDGRFVAFTSFSATLVPNDTNSTWDVFVHDRTTGVTERVSVDSSQVQGDGYSYFPSISADGCLVAFESLSDNLVPADTNVASDVFVHDRTTGVTERVSVDSYGNEADGDSFSPAFTSDGQLVAFTSSASNLIAGDTNGASDAFVHDRSIGITERVSIDSSGSEADGDSGTFSISSDGSRVAFGSAADNLVGGDTNGAYDVFFRDRVAGATKRVSVDSSGAEGNDASYYASISGDGRIVAFTSGATNLVAGDTNGTYDVFVHEFCGTDASWSNYGAGFPGTSGIPAFTSQQQPLLGATVTLDLANSYGLPTTGLIFLGDHRASLPTNRGGTLLVAPLLVLPLSFSYSGDTFTGPIPFDPNLCGVTIDLQAVEGDPGAAKGLSFSRGLELVLGD